MSIAKVANHQHCVECGRAMSYGDEKVCGTECRQSQQAEAKQRRKHMFVLYGLMLVGLVLLFGGSLFGSR